MESIKKNKFYFKIYPYTVDSLDNFSTEGLIYDGELYSGGILPTIFQPLSVQKDNSLGFTYNIPPEGFPAYKGRGRFYNRISISNSGFIGDGRLDYLTSTTLSDKIFFFPDSMNTTSQRYTIRKQKTPVEYPSVNGETVYVHWEPYKDIMLANDKADPMEMYDKQAYLNGMITYTPEKMKGKGMMKVEKTKLYSDHFKYKKELFDSDTTKVHIRTEDETNFAFKTNQVKSNIDFIGRKGTFQSLEKSTFVEFPVNQYAGIIEEFTWEMDKKQLGLWTNTKVEIIERGIRKIVEKEQTTGIPYGSFFFSVHPKQDSLHFISPKTTVYLETNVLHNYDVKYIMVADATVYPGDGNVIVEPQAKMKSLIDARVVADTESQYHMFYNAVVNIRGRYDYSGSADYTYVDENQRKQKVHFDIISVDTSIQTVASGKIKQIDNFSLSPHFDYFGGIKLYARNENLTFTGSVKINHECDMLEHKWVQFSSEIDPNNIYIPIGKEIKDVNNKELLAGMMLGKDSANIYSAFLTLEHRYNDLPMILVDGYLYFDKKQQKFIISSKEKIADLKLPGNYLSVHRTSCNAFAEGNIDLNANLGQIKVDGVGNMYHDNKRDELTMNTMLTIDFFFSEQAIKIMADTIKSEGRLKPFDLSKELYVKSLPMLIDTAIASKLQAETNLFGVYKRIPEELLHTFFLSDVKFKWNKATQSYQSMGKIGISNIGNVQINKYVEGKIEIEKRRRLGDVFAMYLEVDRDNWFFFYYKAGLMQSLSTYKEYNRIVTELKDSKRKQQTARGEEKYFYFISNARKKNEFLKRFEETEN